MNYEIYRANKSLGIVDPTLALAKSTCDTFAAHLYPEIRYEAVELPSGTPTRPGRPKPKGAVVAYATTPV